jgi:DNA processing protein
MNAVERTPEQILGVLNDVERKNAPKQLFLAGDASLLTQGPRISVVGSRRASPEGLKRASYFAKALVAHNMIVVSGLAEGVDTAAHRATIETGGHTIAVLGTPLDEVYPRANAELQALIIAQHLAVSQFPSNTKTQRAHFPQRNRTMALLTDATVIIEAGESSGTLHQGWEALRLGRLLFLLESVAHDRSLTWPAQMIHYGAQVLSRDNLDASLAEIPTMTVRSDETLADLLCSSA